ncbi:alanine and arginine rich protein [Rutstroemia sp. NJR-2017a WRK4]|nr:alanine and arginine rich protein [Rutstroemia sp. NJR-2017a WRK4]
MVGNRKKAIRSKALATLAAKQQKGVSRRGKEDRRAAKLERRRKEKKSYTAEAWAEPAPQHLVAKLDVPKHSSKYQSYFEFAENKEKKKKLEFQVTNDPNPPPGFAYVPIGDPSLTTACKELSREQDAMIFIVSRSKEDNSKISDHVFRTGYHFREVIVEEARKRVGDTIISNAAHGTIEPIPESQEEINKQADAAIRDLFPRIPNTDRQMIIEHAFQKGVKFHGEPTVGLQADLPLSRRVQLAVLAHIRHTHTRYDKLLKETSWINARKAVEPVCLDVLVKWRGDEETGRDQMDEILREVVIITDSEDEDESSDEDDTSDEESTSAESTGRTSAAMLQQTVPITQGPPRADAEPLRVLTSRPRPHEGSRKPPQPRFKRYQAAWEDALNRRRNDDQRPQELDMRRPEASIGALYIDTLPSSREIPREQAPMLVSRPPLDAGYIYREIPPRNERPTVENRYYPQDMPPARPLVRRDEVIVRPLHEQPAYRVLPRQSTPLYVTREPRPQVVVRASPPESRYQDVPMPSIETGQNDGMMASPHVARGPNIIDSHPYQELHSRPLDGRLRKSPGYREVLILDDGSPYSKRRRVIEDDSRRFRPLPPKEQHFDNALHEPVEYRDAQRRHIAVSRPTQGLSTMMSAVPARTERDRVYGPPDSGQFEHYPGPHMRMDIDMGPRRPVATSSRREMASPPLQYENVRNANVGFNVQRLVNENPRVIEHEYGVRHGDIESGRRHYLSRPASPALVSNGMSRSYAIDGPATADPHFVQRFSQSRLQPSISQPHSVFSSSYERVPQDVARQGYEPHQPARSFTNVRPIQPPLHYIERPDAYREASRPPLYHERRDPHLSEQPLHHSAVRGTIPQGDDMPLYSRLIPPRRQVIASE